MIVRALRWAVHPSLLLNTAAPLAAYSLLTRHGVSRFQALIVAAIFPTLADLIGGLSLTTIALSVWVAWSFGIAASCW